MQSWATESYKTSYKQCKHSIAARFIERNKTKEPNSYPSISSRIRFEEKLQKEVRDIPEEFRLSYERSGISTIEIIFSMAEALNMDDAELAYVILIIFAMAEALNMDDAELAYVILNSKF